MRLKLVCRNRPASSSEKMPNVVNARRTRLSDFGAGVNRVGQFFGAPWLGLEEIGDACRATTWDRLHDEHLARSDPSALTLVFSLLLFF